MGLPKQGTVQDEISGEAVEMYCYDPEGQNKLWEDVGPFKTEASLTKVIAPNSKVALKMV